MRFLKNSSNIYLIKDLYKSIFFSSVDEFFFKPQKKAV